MKIAGKIIAAAMLVAAGIVPASAGEFDKPIKARKAQMQMYAWNLGALGAMAKGAVPYDAAAAKAAADNLLALTKMGSAAMWPPGSDSTANPGKTRSKAEIWTTYPAIADKGKAMGEAAAMMAAVAGDGLEAVQANMKAVGGACGGCHKAYREEE